MRWTGVRCQIGLLCNSNDERRLLVVVKNDGRHYCIRIEHHSGRGDSVCQWLHSVCCCLVTYTVTACLCQRASV